MEKMYVVCYNRLNVFNDRKEAISFFFNLYKNSDKNKKIYEKILTDLNYKKIATDGISKTCFDILLHTKNGLDVELNDNMNIKTAISLYENIISPILDVSNEYSVFFDNKNPFKNFDSDEKSCKSKKFLDYYKRILKKFGVSFDNIFTKRVSNEKYILNIDNYNFEINKCDKVEIVIDNIMKIIELFKTKEIENNEVNFEI